MGVWIEIENLQSNFLSLLVTPFMGVWIEISCIIISRPRLSGHSLYGSVD